MARATAAAEGFVCFFGDVGPAHHDGNSDGADGVRHAVGFGNHASHGADSDEADVFFLNKFCDACFVHGLRVAVYEHDFMACGRERFEKKHPKVRHEIASNPVIWVIEQNPHTRITIRSSLQRRGPVKRFVVQEAVRKPINRQ